MKNILILATPRTGSTFYCKHLEEEFCFLNLNEAVRIITKKEKDRHPLDLNFPNTFEDLKKLWSENNTVTKLIPQLGNESAEPIEKWLIKNATEIIVLERKQRENQLASYYYAMKTQNWSQLRKKDEICVIDDAEKVIEYYYHLHELYKKVQKYIDMIPASTKVRHMYTEELPKIDRRKYPNTIYERLNLCQDMIRPGGLNWDKTKLQMPS